MPSFTVGPVAGDYADWAAVITYLATVDPLADDYYFTQTEDCAVNNNWPNQAVAGNRVDFNGHTVHFLTANSPNGDPTTGLITYLTGANGMVDILVENATVNDHFLMDGLYFRQTAVNNVQLVRVSTWDGAAGITMDIRDVLVRGFVVGVAIGLSLGSRASYLNCSNCNVWRVHEAFYFFDNFGGILVYPGRKVVEECTASQHSQRGFRFGAFGSEEMIVRNIVAMDGAGGGGGNFDIEGNVMGINCNLFNCADSDGTALGTDIVHNIVKANEFESLLDTNADFMNLKKGSVAADFSREPAGNVSVNQSIKFTPTVVLTPGAATLADTGMAPTIQSVDIKGLPIPDKNGDYPIGAHVTEYET